MSRKLRISLSAAACMIAATFGLSSPAVASEYWSNSAWYVGDYTDEDGPSCILSTEDMNSDGRSSLFTALTLAPNSTYLSLQNDDWTITAGENYSGLDATFFDSRNKITASYGGADWKGGRGNMLMVLVDNDIIDHFARDQRLVVFRSEDDDDTIVVGRVSLSGSSLAVSKLRECYQRATARYTAQVERERTHPKNPFAR